MSGTGATDKLQAAQRDEVLARATLGAEARALIAGVASLPATIALLASGGFLVEAARVFAHALPRREAVWWAAMCAAATAPAELAAGDRAAREAAEAWVRGQTEAARREAMKHAEQAGFQSPEAWAAVGAFWAGPSIAPEGQPAVPPAPHLTGVAVAGAIALAAVRGDATLRLARLERFLGAAREIAGGGVGRLEPEAGA